MKCKKCNSENPENAVFCRVCGNKLESHSHSKSSYYGICNVLFWMGLLVSSYCLISVLFPISWYEKFFDGSQHLYYSDPFGIIRDGKKWYMQEMMPTLIVSSFVTVILFYLRKKSTK